MTPKEIANKYTCAHKGVIDALAEAFEEHIADAIRAAVEEEREACAQVAEAYCPTQDAAYFAGEIAEQIRARTHGQE